MAAPKLLTLASALALAACQEEAANNAAAPAPAAEANATAETNSAAPAAAAEGEVEATLERFEAGDHLYAVFQPIPGREAESTALIEGGAALPAFLDAHKNQPLHVRIETVNRHLDPPGETMDVTQITAARAGPLTHEAWWASLTPAQRTAAENRVADLMSAPPEE
jgi:hypothetical protein